MYIGGGRRRGSWRHTAYIEHVHRDAEFVDEEIHHIRVPSKSG
jgi:hypothetical protein